MPLWFRLILRELRLVGEKRSEGGILSVGTFLKNIFQNLFSKFKICSLNSSISEGYYQSVLRFRQKRANLIIRPLVYEQHLKYKFKVYAIAFLLILCDANSFVTLEIVPDLKAVSA